MSEKEQILQPLNKNFKEPKLRFPEFKDEWTKIKLCDITTRLRQKNKDNYPYLPLTISAQEGLISQFDYYDKQIASLNLSTYYIIQKGQFAYNKSYSNGYPYGAIKRLNNCDIGVLSSLYICFQLKRTNSDYICFYFDSNKWNKEVRLISGEGARNHGLLNLSADDFFNISLFIPSYLEQEKISKFLLLLYKKIELLECKISILKKYKEGLMIRAYKEAKCDIMKLKELISKNIIYLGRGNIIPKQNGIYPVYSSSAQNNGLFCTKNDYMFDEELITWSVDGGGHPFIRKKHKFSITNVCGYVKINNKDIINYWWLYICFWNNWRHLKFDYTTKAHPSVIEKLYKVKIPTFDYQIKYSRIFHKIDHIIEHNNQLLFSLMKVKKQLLKDLFV